MASPSILYVQNILYLAVGLNCCLAIASLRFGEHFVVRLHLRSFLNKLKYLEHLWEP